MAQVAHATSAVSLNGSIHLTQSSYVLKVLHETRERVETKQYLDDLLNMYKSVFQVRVHPAGSDISEA